jgi:hypothetical protein
MSRDAQKRGQHQIRLQLYRLLQMPHLSKSGQVNNSFDAGLPTLPDAPAPILATNLIGCAPIIVLAPEMYDYPKSKQFNRWKDMIASKPIIPPQIMS